MLLRRFGSWVLNHIVQDVPEDVCFCEFDCREADCSQTRMGNCERRLKHTGDELPSAPSLFDTGLDLSSIHSLQSLRKPMNGALLRIADHIEPQPILFPRLHIE